MAKRFKDFMRPFFLAVFFCVTLDRLFEIGTTRGLDEIITLNLRCRTNCMFI